jgi:hypothetical protein
MSTGLPAPSPAALPAFAKKGGGNAYGTCLLMENKELQDAKTQEDR